MDKPKVTYLVDEAQWELTERFIFAKLFVINAGFRFDLASIPRILWRLLAPFELSIAAPLGHDYLYRHGGRFVSLTGIKRKISRKDADKLFLKVMEDEGVGWFRRKAAYRAVRLFAGGCWRN